LFDTDAKQQQFLTKATATDEAVLQPAALVVLEYSEQNKRGQKEFPFQFLNFRQIIDAIKISDLLCTC